jgi:small subunit ribosomal protein S17
MMGETSKKRILSGVVTSDKMDKTIVVNVARNIKHPMYGKVIQKSKKVKAHDENNACGIGDGVRIIEARPLSRDKRWLLLEVTKTYQG